MRSYRLRVVRIGGFVGDETTAIERDDDAVNEQLDERVSEGLDELVAVLVERARPSLTSLAIPTATHPLHSRDRAGEIAPVGDETSAPGRTLEHPSQSPRETTMGVTRTYQSIGTCQHCGGPLPTSASTGRTRVYCTPACRKAAYEKRRARKPDATIVKVVDRVVIERHETLVDKGHDITKCMLNVAQSPRACANLVGHLAGMARNKELLDDPKWAPVMRALGDLGDALNGDPPRRYR